EAEPAPRYPTRRPRGRRGAARGRTLAGDRDGRARLGHKRDRRRGLPEGARPGPADPRAHPAARDRLGHRQPVVPVPHPPPAALAVGLLYVGIGSLRWSGWRPVTSPHARGHLGFLLALFALALVRGAALDPAEAVAGFHGSVDAAMVAVRLPGARLVEVLGVATVLASLAWGLRDTTRALLVAWGALVLGSLAAYVVAPGVARGPSPVPGGKIERDRLEQLAFGAGWAQVPPPRGCPSIGAAATALPVWDADRVAAVARRAHLWSPRAPVGGVALTARPEDVRPAWLVVPAPGGGASAPEGAGQDSMRS